MTSDFEQAMRAFDLFTLSERLQALQQFAALRYPSLEDRFFEAVYRVTLGLASIPPVRQEPEEWR